MAFIRNQIVQYNQLSPEWYYSGVCRPSVDGNLADLNEIYNI
jgi:hypothetical protein